MDSVEIGDIRYGFARDYKNDNKLRRSFNQLTEATFGFSLEDWYQEGWWGNYYIPYSLLHHNKVISNVSINRIEFNIENESKVGIQLGTVMTDKKYRHRGLNRFIMEQVLDEWKDKVDFIYLFANDTVLDFYPKFGFVKVDEYQHLKTINTHSSSLSWTKLNIANPSDVALLTTRIKESVPISKIAMRNNLSLVMFYCNSYKKNSIFYIEKLDTIVVADFTDDTLYLHDVFSTTPFEINNVIETMGDNGILQVILGFTPLNKAGFDRRLIKGADTLYMLKGKPEFLTDKHWMFPVLSHA